MACITGSDVTRDGLVVYYDMLNQSKSWKGKPTINYYRYTFPDYRNWNNQDVVVERPTADITKMYSASRSGFSGISWMGGTYATDADTSSKLSYSLQVRGVGSARLVVHQASLTPNNPAHASVIAPYVTLHPDEWQTLTLNDFYHVNNVTTQNILIQVLAGAHNYVEVRRPQVEFSDYPTPYVNGVRSNSESILDISGEGNTITATNLSYNADGEFQFDGSDDAINVAATPDNEMLAPFTVDCWVYLDSTQSNQYPRIFNKGPVLLHLTQTPPYSLALNVSVGVLRQVSKGAALVPNQWIHVCCSYDGTSSKLYTNGKHINTASFGSFAQPYSNSTQDLIVGNTGDLSRGLAGSISELRLYNKILTLDEIRNNFNAMRGRYGV